MPDEGLPSVPAKPQGLPFAGVGFFGSTKASGEGWPGRDIKSNPGHSLLAIGKYGADLEKVLEL
jgi:hypothetical protein